ncbi:hypothetical protein KSP40_PGU014135 [Platanthera guangdongensis]|uniref:Uncharacterized protein n=1 Tax=Platanthera guangdongensis TaxID=2320717 RepID=A0ABR2N2H6_9ASPA
MRRPEKSSCTVLSTSMELHPDTFAAPLSLINLRIRFDDSAEHLFPEVDVPVDYTTMNSPAMIRVRESRERKD